jgi:hypothetical protein
MKKATIEILHEDETVLGTKTSGQYMVREYKDGVEMGGSFHKYLHDAVNHVKKYQEMVYEN